MFNQQTPLYWEADFYLKKLRDGFSYSL